MAPSVVRPQDPASHENSENDNDRGKHEKDDAKDIDDFRKTLWLNGRFGSRESR